MDWFISDLHFGHKNILRMERTQFSNVQEHDSYILQKLTEWFNTKAQDEDVLWVLGDFGDINMLQDFWNCFQEDENKSIQLKFVYGNHDKQIDFEEFSRYFDEVNLYPKFIEKRIIVSHEPQYPLPPYMVNIHGHLHGAHLDTNQHFCVSCNDIKYTPQPFKYFNNKLQFVDSWNMRFLWEPYAELYVIHDKNRKGIVMNPTTHKIDVHASRVLQKQMRDEQWNLQNVENN